MSDPVQVQETSGRLRAAWSVLRGNGASLAKVERAERHLAEDVAVEAIDRLETLAAACWRVPVKQHERTPDEQAGVEAFSTAVMESRAWLRSQGREDAE